MKRNTLFTLILIFAFALVACSPAATATPEPTAVATEEPTPEPTEEMTKPTEEMVEPTDILLYHVVEGSVLAETVVTLDSAATLQGSDVAITVEDGTVKINDATVIITDIVASNGVIHVIDAVLLPPES